MLKKIAITASVLLTAVFIYSCSDRGVTTVDEKFPASLVWKVDHVFSEQLGKSMFKTIANVPQVRFRVYTPPQYDPNATGRPFPVLYLLSPYGGDEFFYLDHGLQEVADRMIASKEIKPMIIVSVDGSNGYGGSFYGNMYSGGKYEELIGNKTDIPFNQTGSTLLDYMAVSFRTDTIDGGRAGRAISGVEMGGYGAMKIAIKYSQNFSSVSAVSAPLDFDGATGYGGFMPYFRWVTNPLVVAGDPAQTWQNFKNMDTSSAQPLRQMFFAAACSFSPHDTASIRSDVGSGHYITDTLGFMSKGGGSYQFHLPFYPNAQGLMQVNYGIWNLWLKNDVNRILADFPQSLDSVQVMLMASPQADYGFYQQTLDFSNHLTSLRKTHAYLEFSGYPGYPATGQKFTYDILAKILKFHSDNFIVR